nr:uncharacterized protein LOC101108915 isoform X1 [Ovis aries]
MAEEAVLFSWALLNVSGLDNMSFFSSWIKAIFIIGLAFPLYSEKTEEILISVIGVVVADSASTAHSYGSYYNPILPWILQPISLHNQGFKFLDEQTNPSVVHKMYYRLLENFSTLRAYQ